MRNIPPFRHWIAVVPDQAAGPAAVEAHRRHVERYDLDFLKIMNDNRYPRLIGRQGVLKTVEDLERLPVYRGDEDRFGGQLEVIDHLARHFSGELYLCATVFNAWSTSLLLRGFLWNMGHLGQGQQGVKQKDDPQKDWKPGNVEKRLNRLTEESGQRLHVFQALIAVFECMMRAFLSKSGKLSLLFYLTASIRTTS
jgi:hypothetical protein